MKDNKKIKTTSNHRPIAKSTEPFFQKNGEANSSTTVKSSAAPFFQAKLTIGQPNDKYEQEADRVADAVVGSNADTPSIQNKNISSIQRVSLATPMEDEKLSTAEGRMEKDKLIQEKPELQRKPIFESNEDVQPNQVQRKCADCEQEDGTIQPKSAGGETTTASSGLQSQLNASKGGGRNLPKDTRSAMEQSIGADFSTVRIHTGSTAVQMNKELGAQAFTHGSDIYFNAGKYDTDSTSGKHLLAHELTHVVQQGGGGEKLQRLPLDNEDYEALAEQINQAIKGWGTDEEAVYVALQKLEKNQAAINKLKTKYKAKYSESLESAIRGDFSKEELQLALELININDAGTTPRVGAAPSNPAEYKAAASKLYNAMKDLGTDEEMIFSVLVPFKRDQAKLAVLKSTYKTEYPKGITGKGLEEDIKKEMTGDFSGTELNYALYLLNAPLPAADHTEATVNTPGAVGQTGTVTGGTVTSRTGTQYSPVGGGRMRTSGFSLDYTGALASESRWLQFIWREVIVHHPTKGVYRLNDSIKTSGGSYKFTDDPSKPAYNTDSADNSDPFYERIGFSNRTADSTTIFDFPSSADFYVQRELKGGATKVVSRAHFNSYLIRDYSPMYHMYTRVEWNYTSAAVPARTYSTSSQGKVTALPAGMRKVFVKQYPNFAYIR